MESELQIGPSCSSNAISVKIYINQSRCIGYDKCGNCVEVCPFGLPVENFIGKKPNSVKQEFFANILTYNLSMMTCKPLIDQLTNKKKKKSKYKTNKRAVLAKIKQCFVRLFFGARNVCEILNGIIKSVSKESVPIRMDRKFARGKTAKAKRKLYRAYVSAV